jgi:hypothetical protein
MYSRQNFHMSDTGTMTDTGSPFHGEVKQMRWIHLSGDTGGSIEVGLYPKAGDTGEGFLFLSQSLTPQFTRVPRQPTHDISGDVDQTDTGTPAAPAPIVAAGDRLRVKKTGATGTGRLYIWTGE